MLHGSIVLRFCSYEVEGFIDLYFVVQSFCDVKVHVWNTYMSDTGSEAVCVCV